MKIQHKATYERDNDEKNMDNMLKEFGFNDFEIPQVNFKNRNGSLTKFSEKPEDLSQNMQNEQQKRVHRQSPDLR